MSLRQKATIIKIADNKLYMQACRPESCAGCKAQAACVSPSGTTRDKEIILEDDGRAREVGQEVYLKLSRTRGLKAVMIAYIAPVILIVSALLVFQSIGIDEITAGLITLGITGAYFVLLGLMKNKMKKELIIEIE